MIVEHLFKALEEAKIIESQGRNTSLTKDISAIINRHFKSKENLLKTQTILKASKPSESKSFSEWDEWDFTGKKKINKAIQKEQAAVDNSEADDDNDLPFSEIPNMNNQQLLDYFKGLINIKKISKELGFAIDTNMDPEDFLEEFREAILFSLDEEE